MNLSPHFTLKELTASEIADRHGIDNMPSDPAIIANLKTLAKGLEDVRSLLNRPILVNSAYRCLRVIS